MLKDFISHQQRPAPIIKTIRRYGIFPTSRTFVEVMVGDSVPYICEVTNMGDSGSVITVMTPIAKELQDKLFPGYDDAVAFQFSPCSTDCRCSRADDSRES